MVKTTPLYVLKQCLHNSFEKNVFKWFVWLSHHFLTPSLYGRQCSSWFLGIVMQLSTPLCPVLSLYIQFMTNNNIRPCFSEETSGVCLTDGHLPATLACCFSRNSRPIWQEDKWRTWNDSFLSDLVWSTHSNIINQGQDLKTSFTTSRWLPGQRIHYTWEQIFRTSWETLVLSRLELVWILKLMRLLNAHY